VQGLHVVFSGIDGGIQSRFLRGRGSYGPLGLLTAGQLTEKSGVQIETYQCFRNMQLWPMGSGHGALVSQ
jgi:hypothetical protein